MIILERRYTLKFKMVLEPSDADVRNLDPFLSGHVGYDVCVAFWLYPERGPGYDLCERRCASRSDSRSVRKLP